MKNIFLPHCHVSAFWILTPSASDNKTTHFFHHYCFMIYMVAKGRAGVVKLTLVIQCCVSSWLQGLEFVPLWTSEIRKKFLLKYSARNPGIPWGFTYVLRRSGKAKIYNCHVITEQDSGELVGIPYCCWSVRVLTLVAKGMEFHFEVCGMINWLIAEVKNWRMKAPSQVKTST